MDTREYIEKTMRDSVEFSEDETIGHYGLKPSLEPFFAKM